MKIAIIGDGNVGSALGDALRRAGHEIRHGSTDPNQPVRAAAEWGEVVVLAVPWKNMTEVVKNLGNAANGKVVIDASNPIGPGMVSAVGCDTSAGEEVQKMVPRAKVVKAFNTVFAQHMRTGQINGDRLTAYLAADDTESKRTVRQLAEQIGFEPVDAGPLKAARYLEQLALLNINMAYNLGMGPSFGVKLVR